MKRIFVSYRREDSIDATGRLYDRLEAEFPNAIFMDVEGGIVGGQDFIDVLNTHVAECDVMLAVIGRAWIDCTDEAGHRRLDNENDFVRVEIGAALANGKTVIPVIVSGATIPRSDQLPEALKPLARRHVIRLSSERFGADVQGLIKAIRQSLAEIEQARTNKARAQQLQREREEQETRRRAAEAVRQKAEAEAAARRRNQPAAVTSRESLRKAAELANWNFIQDRADPQELRDHIARYGNGATSQAARQLLEKSAWQSIEQHATLRAVQAFLSEFSTGVHASEARALLTRLQREAEAQDEQRWALKQLSASKLFSLRLIPPVLVAFLVYNAAFLLGVEETKTVLIMPLPSGGR